MRKTGFRCKLLILIFGIYFISITPLIANNHFNGLSDPSKTSTQKEALDFINSVKELEPSVHWPKIKPNLFIQNLKLNINEPMSIYPGRGTYFCGYGAFTYLFLQDDPLGYTKLLLQLYTNGKAEFGTAVFNPSDAIKKEAGQFKYKGVLDIRPAEQMWYLTLADHFKGYLNLFNRNYDPGDEDNFWASVNYAKFNRMIRTLLNYKVNARGSDLFRPVISDLYNYISKKLQDGIVVLYINNRIVHKKNHTTLKLDVPTHFVVLQQITKVNDLITLVYWDYGERTLRQLSPSFLGKIIFGITNCSKK